LGNASAVRGFSWCQKAEEVDILFLSETKLDEKRMQVFMKKLGMMNLEVVDCEGKRVGIAALWRNGVNVVLRSK
jgi:exonuclease III